MYWAEMSLEKWYVLEPFSLWTYIVRSILGESTLHFETQVYAPTHQCRSLAFLNIFADLGQVYLRCILTLTLAQYASVPKSGQARMCRRLYPHYIQHHKGDSGPPSKTQTAPPPWLLTADGETALQILSRDDRYKFRLQDHSRHASIEKQNKQLHPSSQNLQTQSNLTIANRVVHWFLLIFYDLRFQAKKIFYSLKSSVNKSVSNLLSFLLISLWICRLFTI